MLHIEIANEQTALEVSEEQLVDAMRTIAREFGFFQGELSLAIVDDPTIHRVNFEHLRHDYATDVVSFVFDRERDHIEGEIIVSTDTAIREAKYANWSSHNELLLYVIHGMLHLIGMDDQTEVEALAMRHAERKYLVQFGIDITPIGAPDDFHQWEPE